MIKDPFTLVFKAYKMVTPTVRHMAFTRKDGAKFEYTPGQFITFHFEYQGAKYNRSYSVATIPTQSDNIEIAVSPFPGGPGTEFLFHLQPGDEVETTGPFGRLILREEQPKRYILVATGTGVTPYRSMLPELHRRIEEEQAKVVVLLGVQRPEDLLYGGDFVEFAGKHPDFQFQAFYSRELPENHQAHEQQGYVQSAFVHLELDPENDIVYLCGNPNMIDEAFTLLQEAGFATRNVRREKYISPKRPV